MANQKRGDQVISDDIDLVMNQLIYETCSQDDGGSMEVFIEQRNINIKANKYNMNDYELNLPAPKTPFLLLARYFLCLNPVFHLSHSVNGRVLAF